MSALSELTKFSSTQITTSDTFKDFFGEFLKYIELSLKTPQSKINIDKLDDSFIDNYKRIYMSNVPDTNVVKSLNNEEIKRVLKDIVLVNKNKGVIETIEYMFKTLYGDYDVKISSGINSAVVEYKPDDYTVEFVDNNFNTITDYDFNSLSNQPFTFVDDPTIRGFVVTIFDGNHLWVDKLYGKVFDGDILYFPNLNSYVRVLTTNKLELDGWEDKDKRYKLEYFYSKSKINQKLYSVYTNELYGYDYLNNATINDITFGNPENGKGSIDNLNLHFTSGNNNYNHNIDYSINVDGVTYTTNIKISTNNRKSTLKINDNIVDLPLSDRIVYRLSAYEFLDDSGKPIVDKDVIDYRIARISFFTYIIETKLKPDQFMGVLRNSVIPAGYNFVSLVTVISDLIDIDLVHLIKSSEDTPKYSINYVANKKSINLSKFYGKTKICNLGIIGNTTNRSMSFVDWDKNYKFDRNSNAFFNVNTLNTIFLSFLRSSDYYNTNIYEIATLPSFVHLSSNESLSVVYTKNKKYNIHYSTNIQFINSLINSIENHIQYDNGNDAISMSFYDFDLNYKFSKWANSFFTLGDFDDIDMEFLDSPDYYNQLVYNKITKQSIINI